MGPEYKSETESTKDTPYLALTAELWCVFCKTIFGDNWPCYNGTALYLTHEGELCGVFHEFLEEEQPWDIESTLCIIHK